MHDFYPLGRDSVGGLMRDDAQIVKRTAADPETAQGRKLSRDFGHQSIW